MQSAALHRKARRAINKPPALGSDVDLGAYRSRGPLWAGEESLSDEVRVSLAEMGFAADAREAFLQVDHSLCRAQSPDPAAELLGIREALERYGGLPDHWWRAVEVDADKFTAHAELALGGGYFVRVRAGTRVDLPVQACLLLSGEGVDQTVHNVVIVEEGASLRLFTGCASTAGVRGGLHVGVSEFYVGRDARLSFTMVHNWAEDLAVRPRSGIVVEEGGRFVSNYIALRPVRTVQTFPWVRLGAGASARLTSVFYAHPGSELDIGGGVILEGEGASAQVISRAVTAGGSVVARGRLSGQAPGAKAHLECSALILDPRGRVSAIPELEASDPDVTMTHEAAVGRIAPEELRYLQARGLTEGDATSLLVRGFLDVEMEDVGAELRAEIDRLFASGKGL